jgi:hypothetical protein
MTDANRHAPTPADLLLLWAHVAARDALVEACLTGEHPVRIAIRMGLEKGRADFLAATADAARSAPQHRSSVIPREDP